MRRLRMRIFLVALALVIAGVLSVGCATKGQTGAIAGGGVGALVGQAIGGNTEATLIGAAVGTGIGYIIGNKADKKHAKEMSQTTQSAGYDHNEVTPLNGTRWKVVDVAAPDGRIQPFTSKIIEFGQGSRQEYDHVFRRDSRGSGRELSGCGQNAHNQQTRLLDQREIRHFRR